MRGGIRVTPPSRPQLHLGGQSRHCALLNPQVAYLEIFLL